MYTLDTDPSLPLSRSTEKKARNLGLTVPLAFFGTSLLLIVLHQGRLLDLFYPAAAFFVGIVLYRYYPVHYVGYLFWLFFLSPEVRRLADYYNGAFDPTSPIQLSPLLVAALSGFTLLRRYKVLGQRRAMPVLMVLLGLIYAYGVGTIRNGPLPATYAMISWTFPLLIAFHMLVDWRLYSQYQQTLLKTFVYGTLVMGIYGIIQYVIMPPWDAFWLISSKMASEGLPVPFGVRVSSTMNSTGPFAITIMATLLFATAAIRGPTRLSASVSGICSLLLTFSRGGWGSWTVGMIYIISTLNGKARLRVIFSCLILVGCLTPLLAVDQIATPLISRMQTIGGLKDDNSYNDRTQFYHQFLTTALTDIAGQGMGSTGQSTKLSDDNNTKDHLNFDSGLMEIPYVMGWPGTILYGGGLIWLLWRAIADGRRMRDDKFVSASVGVALAVFSLLIFFNTMTGNGGMFFFIAVVLPTIAARYNQEIKASGLESKQNG